MKTSVWTLRLSIGLAALYLAFHGSLGAQTYSFSTYVSGGLNAPEGVAVDTQSNLYVADAINCVIRKVTPAGVVSILAGNGGIGSADGRGAAASFYYPQGVAVDAAGTVFVADTYNHTIRVITPAGQVSTLAGYPTVPGGVDGTGEYESTFNYPIGIAVDSGGNNIYVADTQNSTIRQISGFGVVTTLAGYPQNTGTADDTGTSARFNYPEGIAVDGVGNLYVADTQNSTIRKITSGGVVTTLAGSAGQVGYIDAAGTSARFRNPDAIAIDSSGNLYVADTLNNAIRKITAGAVITLGGNTSATAGNGIGISAGFYSPRGIAIGGTGNLYIGDTGNNLVRLGVIVPPYITMAAPHGQSAAVIFSTGFTVNITLTNAVNYRIQYSSDLKSWSDLSHVVGTTGVYSYPDLPPSGVNQRFYRTISP